MRVTLNAGPIDGRRLEIPGAQLGDILEIELHSGEVHRYFIEEQHGKNLVALSIGAGWDPSSPASVISLAERDLSERWDWSWQDSAFERTETTGPARPSLAEIFASLVLFGALALGLGLLILVGWIIGETLHGWIGSWTGALLWLSTFGAVAGALHLIAFPDYWKGQR